MNATIDAPVADLEAILGTAPPEECAHIVRRAGQLGAGAPITATAEAGMEVEALCGHRWVPRCGSPRSICRRVCRAWRHGR